MSSVFCGRESAGVEFDLYNHQDLLYNDNNRYRTMTERKNALKQDRSPITDYLLGDSYTSRSTKMSWPHFWATKRAGHKLAQAEVNLVYRLGQKTKRWTGSGSSLKQEAQSLTSTSVVVFVFSLTWICPLNLDYNCKCCCYFVVYPRCTELPQSHKHSKCAALLSRSVNRAHECSLLSERLIH